LAPNRRPLVESLCACACVFEVGGGGGSVAVSMSCLQDTETETGTETETNTHPPTAGGARRDHTRVKYMSVNIQVGLHPPFPRFLHASTLMSRARTRHRLHNTLQRTATHCNALQRTATCCITLQRTATPPSVSHTHIHRQGAHEPRHHLYNALQHTTTHCITLQPPTPRFLHTHTLTRRARTKTSSPSTTNPLSCW